MSLHPILPLFVMETIMRLATVPWKDSSSAAVVFGDRVAAVRQLSGSRPCVRRLIHHPQALDRARVAPTLRTVPRLLRQPGCLRSFALPRIFSASARTIWSM